MRSATASSWTTSLPPAPTCRACINGGLLHRAHHRVRAVTRWGRAHLPLASSAPSRHAVARPQLARPHLSIPRVAIPHVAMPHVGIPRREGRLDRTHPLRRGAAARQAVELWRRTEHLRFAATLLGMVALFYAMSQYSTG